MTYETPISYGDEIRRIAIHEGRIKPAHPNGIIPSAPSQPISADEMARRGFGDAARAVKAHDAAVQEWRHEGRMYGHRMPRRY